MFRIVEHDHNEREGFPFRILINVKPLSTNSLASLYAFRVEVGKWASICLISNLLNFSSNHEASMTTCYTYVQRMISSVKFKFHVLMVWIRLPVLGILISFAISFLFSKLKFPSKCRLLHVIYFMLLSRNLSLCR